MEQRSDVVIELAESNETSSASDVATHHADEADGRRGTSTANYFHTKKSAAEGMMDLSLLTANANQLKFLLFYNQNSSTFWPTISLIILSLVFQVIIGITLIFRVSI